MYFLYFTDICFCWFTIISNLRSFQTRSLLLNSFLKYAHNRNKYLFSLSYNILDLNKMYIKSNLNILKVL